MKQLVVEIAAPGAAGNPLPRSSVPETTDEVIAEVADRPLGGDEFLAALDRLDAAAPQPER